MNHCLYRLISYLTMGLQLQLQLSRIFNSDLLSHPQKLPPTLTYTNVKLPSTNPPIKSNLAIGYRAITPKLLIAIQSVIYVS